MLVHGFDAQDARVAAGALEVAFAEGGEEVREEADGFLDGYNGLVRFSKKKNKQFFFDFR